MNLSRSLSCLCLLLLPAWAVACNGDGDDEAADDSISVAGSLNLLPTPITGARGAGSPPALGPRIDRAGRVAITAALISPFEADADVTARDRKAYNASGLSNQTFAPMIRKSLGVLDGLDGTCGTQVLASPGLLAAGSDRYAALTQVLLDDQLYVHSNRNGSIYLGLEAEAIGALPPGDGAAGGREPGDDVIARSYSVLAAGALNGVDDGVPSDDATHNPDVFPFLAAPR
jgi:hypothetical protein